MRESNFNFPSQNRASVCISSALYDRRAIDAPSPSLPLVNSLTHLSYLTATSPRIREILSLDGGLERLVRILKGCASGGPDAIEETLAQLKGKGKTLAKGSRRSPFRPFSEYREPTLLPGGAPFKSTLSSPAFAFDESATPSAFPPPYAFAASSSASASSSLAPLAPPPPPPPSEKSKHLVYTYNLAFQCVVNIGVRGSEMIRTRVVEAGALDVVVHVLERYLEKSSERKRPAVIPSSTAGVRAPPPPPPARVATPDAITSVEESIADDAASSSSGHDEDDSVAADAASRRSSSRRQARSGSKLGRAGPIDHDGDVVMSSAVDVDEQQPQQPDDSESALGTQASAAVPSPRPTPSSSAADGVLQYRDEDVLLSLQLLAYLSKYPHVRSVFHSPSDVESGDEDQGQDLHAAHDDCGDACTSVRPSVLSRPSKTDPAPTATTPTLSSNVFSLVEAFTHRPPASDKFTPRHSNEVQYWAGVIMRNACRKDENQGGIRQCANMQCGVWEKTAREFAKCRRCRKAKYCSKSCQSKAWQFGHRYWCTKATPREDGEPDGADELVPRSRSRREGRTRTSELGHHHGHDDARRPGTAQSFDDEDEDDLPAPSTSAGGGIQPTADAHARHSAHQSHHVGVAGMGVRVGPDDNDELQDMAVFDEMGQGGTNA
ncbi:hypothetical protein RQP46_007046 [Phenoliferia psychrophenolica]